MSFVNTGTLPLPESQRRVDLGSAYKPPARYIVVDTTDGEIVEFHDFHEMSDYVSQEVRYKSGVNPFRVFSIRDEFEVRVETTHKVTLKQGA